MAHLTITHTHEDGTQLTGSRKGQDNVYEIVSKKGFTWRRGRGIHIRPSRDLDAKTWIINAAAAALREAGHDVTVEIDNTPRPVEVVETERKDRAEERAERLTERAGKAHDAGDARLNAARAITDGIPFGQPVLVDHYSAGRHRNALKRADSHRGKAVELWDKGEYLASRARGAAANQQQRENPRTTMRRIDKLEADKRRYQRELDGYERRFRNGTGEVVDVEKHRPATDRRREDLERWIAHADEQITYWRAQLAAHAESGVFVPWAREHFAKGDWVRCQGLDWYEVIRVNPKSVSVIGESWGWPRTVSWDKVAGRRRDGMQWDTPNGEPWPVEQARKVARWHGLERDLTGNDSSTEALFKRGRIELARNITLGLDMNASEAEVQACLQGVPDVATERRVKAAFVEVYDRLAAGENAAEVKATYEPIELAAAWRMPGREPVDRTAAKSFSVRNRDDIIAVQPGDLIVGFYDRGYGRGPLVRSFCGPVAAVSEVNNRREAGDFVTITLVDRHERTFKLPLWFAVHPAGTWEQEASPAVVARADATGANEAKQEQAESIDVAAAAGPTPAPSAADSAVDSLVAQWNAAVASDDAQRIAQAKTATLTAITERIMNDDPRAVLAGWKPTDPTSVDAEAAAPDGTVPSAVDDEGDDPWGPLLVELGVLAGQES